MFINIYCSGKKFKEENIIQEKKIKNKNKKINFKENLLFKKCDISFNSTEINFYQGYKIKFDQTKVVTDNCVINLCSPSSCKSGKNENIQIFKKEVFNQNKNTDYESKNISNKSKSISIIKNELDVLNFQYFDVLSRLYKICVPRQEQKLLDFSKLDKENIDYIICQINETKQKIIKDLEFIKTNFMKITNKEKNLKIEIQNMTNLTEKIEKNHGKPIGLKRKSRHILVNECKKKIHISDEKESIDYVKYNSTINNDCYNIKEEEDCCDESLLKKTNRLDFIQDKKNELVDKKESLQNLMDSNNKIKYDLFFKKNELESKYQAISFLDLKRCNLSQRIDWLNQTSSFLVKDFSFAQEPQVNNCFITNNNVINNSNQEVHNINELNTPENKNKLFEFFKEIEKEDSYTTMSDITPQKNMELILNSDKKSDYSQQTTPLFHCFLNQNKLNI